MEERLRLYDPSAPLGVVAGDGPQLVGELCAGQHI
jgi:hypothetical protein